jgi:levansucrase
VSAPPVSAWRPGHLAGAPGAGDALPVIGGDDLVRILPGHDLWDLGPVRTPDGDVARIGGAVVWLALSAPAVGEPALRHDIARLRLVAEGAGGFRDLGPLFPDGASPGSREWAGSAVHDAARATLEVLYTAAGSRDGSRPRFTQRIVAAAARVEGEGGTIRLTGWAGHRVVLEADGELYACTDAEEGEPGFISAFRDPFPFRDPADGRDWLLFAASRAGARSSFDGAVGLARATGDGGYALEPPLLHAEGVTTELERPHLVVHDGRYHLFASTQARTFAPGVAGPTGLYGFVAPALRGPYVPLNGSGVVLRNPDAEPTQAYSWLVLPDLRVASFVDAHSLGGRTVEEVTAAGAGHARRHFGGTLAPIVRLWLDGDAAGLAG